VNDSTFLTRVILKNYRSIAHCDVPLRPLTFLVGPNGSGKSNFLDALRFVSDALNTTLDHALRDRGGINDVRRRSAGHPNHFSIELRFRLPDDSEGLYRFKIGAQARGGFEVQSEEFKLARAVGLTSNVHFRVERGQVVSASVVTPPAAAIDRLYLVNVSGLAEFRPVYDALRRMGFYNLDPNQIRNLQSPDAGEVLARDGGNLASLLGRLERESPKVKERIEEHLSKVVPGVSGIESRSVGPKETIEFRQQVGANQHPWRFLAANMSDGTLRAVGILVALFQSSNGTLHRVPLVGIEEPEVALHPAAAEVLRDSLRDASRATQVLVTSHSPDLLDDPDIPDDWIMPVVAEQGDSIIAPLDEAGRTAIQDKLYTPGELLRLDQLRPEHNVARKVQHSSPLLPFEGQS
jgi:predicted ATPase